MSSEKGSILAPFKALKYLFKKPHTLRYPFELKETSPRYRGFHVNDFEQCTGCGDCADICPNDAITMKVIEGLVAEPGRTNERPEIDYGRCCFCGLCVDICPPGSLSLSRDYIHIDHGTDSFVVLADSERCRSGELLVMEVSILECNLPKSENYHIERIEKSQ